MSKTNENEHHIRNEAATRIKYGLVGNGKELDDDRKIQTLCVAWCGEDTHRTEFFFHGIDHAVASLEADEGLRVCKSCLSDVRSILDAEFCGL